MRSDLLKEFNIMDVYCKILIGKYVTYSYLVSTFANMQLLFHIFRVVLVIINKALRGYTYSIHTHSMQYHYQQQNWVQLLTIDIF